MFIIEVIVGGRIVIANMYCVTLSISNILLGAPFNRMHIALHIIISGLLNCFDSNCLGHRASGTDQSLTVNRTLNDLGQIHVQLQPHLIVFPLNMVIMNSIQLGHSLCMFTHLC